MLKISDVKLLVFTLRHKILNEIWQISTLKQFAKFRETEGLTENNLFIAFNAFWLFYCYHFLFRYLFWLKSPPTQPPGSAVRVKQVAYCQVDAQMSGKYGVTRDYHKSKWNILRLQFMKEQALKQKPPKTSSKVSLLHCACTFRTFSHRGTHRGILVPRAYDPSGLRQESRALGATISP